MGEKARSKKTETTRWDSTIQETHPSLVSRKEGFPHDKQDQAASASLCSSFSLRDIDNILKPESGSPVLNPHHRPHDPDRGLIKRQECRVGGNDTPDPGHTPAVLFSATVTSSIPTGQQRAGKDRQKASLCTTRRLFRAHPQVLPGHEVSLTIAPQNKLTLWPSPVREEDLFHPE